VDLSGQWRVAISNDDRRRDALSIAAGTLSAHSSDPAWETAQVPGHWQTVDNLKYCQGPVIYQRDFSIDPPEVGRRRWLEIDGIFSEGDVWLDGAYLGDLEGYVARHLFEITALSHLDPHHQLVVEVSSPPESPHGAKRNLSGAFHASPGIDTDWNPGGIRGPVMLRDTGPVCIQSLRVVCRDADAARAHLLLHLTVDADANRRIRLRTLVDGRAMTETEHLLAAGPNEVAWGLDIPEPALWWPRSLGPQPLSEITVEILHEGRLSDTAARTTGFREVAWDQWICSVNGQRIFVKGANLLPTRLDIANASEAEIVADLHLAAEVGLDLVRVHSHIASDQLYAAADQIGMLILQDLGLSARYARNVRTKALAHARAAVDRIGHHPSIVMWSAHDAPSGHTARNDPGARNLRGRLRSGVREQLPSWNRTVLDRFVKRVVEGADPTRPCVPNSGVAPHLPLLEGTDSHLGLGWTHGRARDLIPMARAVPRRVRFVSEFGAQAVPASADFISVARWPELDWEYLRDHHGADVEILQSRFPTERYRSFDQWREATQIHQAELIRTYVETLRRLKYQPAGGFCLFSLNSPSPAISHAVIDHAHHPKRGLEALRAACAPVLPIADLLEEPLRPGSRHRVQIHVVNDLPSDIGDAKLHVTVTGIAEPWIFEGPLSADSCAYVGKVSFTTPVDANEMEISLRLDATGHNGAISAHNAYRYGILRT
jgi:beta-mannosidase